MKKFFIGRSPLTSIAGYVLAIVTGIAEASSAGAHCWKDFLLPVSLALFGRLTADDSNNGGQPPLLSPFQLAPDEPLPEDSTLFIRRGRMQRQRRKRNGQFAMLAA